MYNPTQAQYGAPGAVSFGPPAASSAAQMPPQAYSYGHYAPYPPPYAQSARLQAQRPQQQPPPGPPPHAYQPAPGHFAHAQHHGLHHPATAPPPSVQHDLQPPQTSPLMEAMDPHHGYQQQPQPQGSYMRAMPLMQASMAGSGEDGMGAEDTAERAAMRQACIPKVRRILRCRCARPDRCPLRYTRTA